MKGEYIMKAEYHEDTGATLVAYKAGKAFDNLGYPAPFWACYVTYMHSEIDKMYWVYAVQVQGTGMAADQTSRETKMASFAAVEDYLEYLEMLEMHHKRVYGE